MKGKHGTGDSGLGGGGVVVGVWKQGTGGRERDGGREQANWGGTETLLGVVWCGPITPQDITGVNGRR